MTEKLGIEKLKLAILAVITLGEKIENSREDGKTTLIESIAIGTSTLPDVIKIIKNGEQIKAEFLDLDEAEKTEIVEFIKSELDLINDKLEEIIEKAVEIIAYFDSMRKLFE